MTLKTRQAMELHTKRLHLRRPADRDIVSIIAIAGDWEVSRRLGRVPHPYKEADARYFLETVVANEPTWAVVWQQTGQLIGMVGLAPSSEGRSAELGYYLGRDHWGLGIATEAAGAIVRTSHKSFGYHKLTSGYHADNIASGRVLAKLGFVTIGTSSRPCLAEGRAKDSVEVELQLRPGVSSSRN
jgi:RimJ/RimL family protein N-acetyltransferase